MKNAYAAGILLTAWAGLLCGQSAPIQCNGTAPAVPTARTESGAELVGDYVLTCTGGIPTGSTQTVPVYSLTLTLTANATGRLLAPGWGEALVLVDEPSDKIQLACATANGICPMTGTGNGVGTYSGAQGRPNVFQGQVAGSQVSLTNFPLDAPGTGTRTLRFTNLKVYGITAGATVRASLFISGSPSISINNTNQTIASVQAGASFQTKFVQSGRNGLEEFTVNFLERFTSVLRTRTSAAYVNTETSPAPVSQAIPGQPPPGTETGFYNSALPNITGRGNLGLAGLPDNGSRILVTVGRIPAGVTVFTAPALNLVQFGSITGIIRLISADTTGRGPFSPMGACCSADVALVPDSNGTARAVFEVLQASPTRIETVDIPFTLSYGSGAPAVTSLSVTAALAPTSQVSTADLTAPLPRFGSTVTFTLPAISITPATIPAGALGAAYSVQFAASGGSGPYFWSTTATLPSGLTLSGSGVLSGTPTATGSYPVSITATDSTQAQAIYQYTLVVAPQGIQISPTTLPNGSVGLAYSQTLIATGGTPPYTFSLLSGSLPAGLVLAPNGTLSGIPTAASSYTFTVNVNAGNANASQQYTLTINPALNITTPSPLPAGAAGTAYTVTFSATGGTPPYTFSVSGSPPFGLALSTSGVLSGTPTSAGTQPITAVVRDSVQASFSKTFSLTIGNSPPLISVTKTSLDFLALVGGDQPPPQGLAILSIAGPTVDFALVIDGGTANTSPPAWLSIKLSSGVTPAGLQVYVDQDGLAAGTYNGRLRFFIAGNASQPPVDVLVTLTVVASTAQLEVTPSVMKLRTRINNPDDTGDVFLVARNSGGGAAISFNAVSVFKTPWIADISPNNGRTAPNGPAFVRVRLNKRGLQAGSYRDVIRFTWIGGTVDVPIILYVAEAGPLLAVNVTGQRFQSRKGGGYSLPQAVQIANFGDPGTIVNWTAEILAGDSWLSLGDGPTKGSLAAGKIFTLPVTGRPGAADRPEGGSYGLIRITDPAALNPIHYVTIVLDQASETSPTLPDFAPGPFVISVPAGSGTQSVQVKVYASSATAKNFFSSAVTDDGGTWLTTSSSGTASTGNPGTITALINTTRLAPGIYKGQLNVAMSGALRTKDFTVIVTPAGASTASVEAERPAVTPTAGCVPGKLSITQAGVTDSFAVPAGWPATLVIQLTDDCGTPVTNGSVSASFSNGDPPLTLDSDNNTGSYSATWQPGTVTPQMTVTIRASSALLAQATARLSGTVNPNTAPVLARGGTVNNLNPLQGGSLAPGTVAQVFGSGLAGETASVPAVPLPTLFRGTTVLVGGLEAPLYFVSGGQLNVQIPNELKPNRQYPVIVSANGALTIPDLIDVVPFQPGVAQFADGGLIAQHAADFKLVTSANPAKPGEFLIMYLVGMGATTVPVLSGTTAPGGPFAEVTEKATVTVDGQPAVVGFAGMTPGGVGLFQINFQVPAAAATGNLEVMVKQGTLTANVTKLPVQR